MNRSRALAAAAGNRRDAERALADVRGAGFRHVRRDWLRRPALALAAHTAYLLGDAASARELIPLLESMGVPTLVIGNSIANLGPTERDLGLVHATAGDRGRAVALLKNAFQQCEQMRAAALADRCAEELAVIRGAQAKAG